MPFWLKQNKDCIIESVWLKNIASKKFKFLVENASLIEIEIVKNSRIMIEMSDRRNN